MRGRWKRLSHSLLALLMAFAIAVCAMVSMLISRAADQSVDAFEDFIIRQRQQETGMAVASLSQEIDSLNTLLTNVLVDSSLVYVQHFLDSEMLNTSYLQQVNAMQSMKWRAIPCAASKPH